MARLFFSVLFCTTVLWGRKPREHSVNTRSAFHIHIVSGGYIARSSFHVRRLVHPFLFIFVLSYCCDSQPKSKGKSLFGSRNYAGHNMPKFNTSNTFISVYFFNVSDGIQAASGGLNPALVTLWIAAAKSLNSPALPSTNPSFCSMYIHTMCCYFLYKDKQNMFKGVFLIHVQSLSPNAIVLNYLHYSHLIR